MDTHLVRRGDAHSASPTSKLSNTSTSATSPQQQSNAHSPSSLNKMSSVSIPLDASGNPLPWSRDSIIRWARNTGFSKFIPAFIQYGIEGYMFYTLKLEDIREMRVPNATMQDMIQLNGAIYRLNVAAASPANRSHMSGTIRQGHGNAPPGAAGHHIHETQLLSRPLQPLRPPRPSWTVRREDPQQLMYPRQVQLTSNGMVARPVRTRPQPHPAPLPPRLGRPPQQLQQHPSNNTGAIVYSQQLTNAKPLDPALQLQNAVRENPTLPNAPITINTGMSATPSPDADGASTARTWIGARNKGVSPHSGGREGQQQQQQPPQQHAASERPSRYGTGQSTYRSRNSAHVEVDELPFVRPTQNTWAGGSGTQQQHNSPGQPPRRRSAVIEVFDETPANMDSYSAATAGQQQQQQQPPAIVEPSGSAAGGEGTLPARYHGTNQPHSPYYAHGASVTTTAGAFSSYRGAGGPTPRPGGKFHTAQPYPVGRQRRGGMHGLFENYGLHGGGGPGSASGLSPRHPEHATGGGGAKGHWRHPQPPLRPPPPPPHMRRTSLSPVLTALQPGNYHIANLPDTDLDGSSSSDSETAETPHIRGRGHKVLPPPSAIPLAINTTLLHNLQASPCDTGDSTITPLSVVNVLPDALSTSTSPSSQASRGAGYEARVPVEDACAISIATSTVIFDAESMTSSDDEDECRSNGSAANFDLVENAVPIEELAMATTTATETTTTTATVMSAVGDFEIWDAEELEEEDESKDNGKLYGKSPEPETADDTLVQQQQSASSSASSVFRVMGVRHVSSYSPDFDKTAASLLSSIKTDMAKRVASGEATKRNREFANAASIAAAIEYHQQKQQQKQSPVVNEEGEQQRHHTSRLSGFFGFGQRTAQRSGASLQPLSTPQPLRGGAGGGGGRAPSPKAASELRVVTDLQTLRSGSGSVGAVASSEQTATASSAEGMKSASPSTLTRRWRVPFMQRVSGDSDAGSRRSRGRAGTTSDIESPLIAPSTAERPVSMVEGSGSSSGVTSGRSTPRTAAALLQRQQRLAESATDSASTRSFVTASPGEGPTFEPSPIARADSWTLMFFSKEFVVPQKVEIGEIKPVTDALTATPGAEQETQTTVTDTEEPLLPPQDAEGCEENDDDLLWGGAAPPVVSEDDDDDPKAAAVRADIAEQQQSDEEADAQSIASSTRTLPSTMRFTRGMRATLLERQPSRNVRERPTADVIGDQLDKYFPGHDLDRPIVQAVPVDGDDGLLHNPEFHIILDDEEARSQPSSSSRTVAAAATASATQARLHRQQRRPATNTAPVSTSAGPGRRKSVRMLVQEQRMGRQGNSSRRAQNPDPAVAASEPSAFPVLPPEPPSEPWPELIGSPTKASAVVRRKSTKLWGCIPEEIRPRGRRGAVDVAASSADSQLQPPVLPVLPPPPPQSSLPPPPPPPPPNDEIVRRALSLLRKPESNPQAEKEIVEAAIKCADTRTAGSTRAQFVHEQEMKRRQAAGSPDDSISINSSSNTSVSTSSRSVNDTVRALFVKYGVVAPAGSIRFQWIKGKLIGKGSFGHVHVALNAGTGEVIAVKQIRLPTSLCAAAPDQQQQQTETATAAGSGERGKDQLQEEAIRMMYTEIELLQDMDHENIVQLLGFEVARGVMSMFLEYVPGGTVQSLVQQHGPLPESVVHSFLRQVLAGLGYLHDRGILHRDIKGANILVDETGTCKISDFGISRKADRPRLPTDGAAASAASTAPRRGRILGTVPFMAPEVVRASEYTAGGDIWALGCVVLQMWSGRGPWDDLQEPQVFFKLGKGLAPPIPDDLTEAGIDFCKNCFGADPASRWAAAELARMDFAQVPADYAYPYRG
ncbi:mitogen-activated protein kinase kinase kinase [Coemansia sp. RSA 1843]|nr:mitogen-activated protein kinase kinase kinase [Coemansia sp. RSA 1843]